MRRVSSNQKNQGAAKRPNISGEPNFSLISRQHPLPPPMPISSDRAAMLPAPTASQPPAVVKSPTLMHITPAHDLTQHGSAQNQTALMKSSQAQTDSAAVTMTVASVPTNRLPANPSARDHAAAAHVVDLLPSVGTTTTLPTPTAAIMKSHDPLNYEPFHQMSILSGNANSQMMKSPPADTLSALPASSSSFGSASMSYQHYLYQVQECTRLLAAEEEKARLKSERVENQRFHMLCKQWCQQERTLEEQRRCTHAITDTTESSSSSSNRGGSPGIEPCEFPLQSRVDVEQKQAIQQAGYPPRSDGCALEPSASTQYYYNPPAHCGGNHFSHQETTSTTQESQPRVITQGYEPKGTSDDDIDESYDDDFLSFLTKL